MLVEFRERMGLTSVEETVQSLQGVVGLCRSEQHTRHTLSTMIDHGHKYRNLERHLGHGVCLFLGISLSETHWTKLMTKTTTKFQTVLELIRKTPIPELAMRYACLRDVIVNAKLETFYFPAQQFHGNMFMELPLELTQVNLGEEMDGFSPDDFYYQNWPAI